MAQVAGELEIRLVSEISRLTKGMDDAKRTVSASMKNIESSVAMAKSALGALGIGISAIGFVNLVRGSIDAMDKLNDLSKSTGLTIETLAGLQVAAKQSGGDLDSIAQSVNKLSVEMGKAPEKFKALGISATDPLEAFKQLADISNSLLDPMQRAAFLAAALGKSWAGAAPLLAEGSAKISEMVAAGTKASGMTGELAKQADLLNDKWTLLWGSGGLVNSIVGQMLPTLTRLTDQLIEAKDASSGFWEALMKFATTGGGNDIVGKWLGLVKETQALTSGYERSPAFASKSVTPGAGAKVGAFLGTGDDAAKAAAAAKKLRDEQVKFAHEADQSYRQMYSDQMIASAEAAAAAIANARASSLSISDLIAEQTALNDADRAATIAKNQLIAEANVAKFEALKLGLMTEDELRKFGYESDFNLLQKALDDKLIAYETYATLMGRLIKKNEAQELAIERDKHAALRNMQIGTWQLGSQLLQQMAGESKAAAIASIAINKGLAIAMVVQNMTAGAARAFMDFPYPIAVGMAASIKALAGVQIGLIAATGLMEASNVGSGGAAPGTPANPINTTPAEPAATASAGSGTTTIVHLHGETFSRKQVQALMEKINDASKDGRVILA